MQGSLGARLDGEEGGRPRRGGREVRREALLDQTFSWMCVVLLLLLLAGAEPVLRPSCGGRKRCRRRRRRPRRRQRQRSRRGPWRHRPDRPLRRPHHRRQSCHGQRRPRPGRPRHLQDGGMEQERRRWAQEHLRRRLCTPSLARCRPEPLTIAAVAGSCTRALGVAAIARGTTCRHKKKEEPAVVQVWVAVQGSRRARSPAGPVHARQHLPSPPLPATAPAPAASPPPPPEPP